MEPEKALRLMKQYQEQLELEEVRGPFFDKMLELSD
jgi:hypothetical protein